MSSPLVRAGLLALVVSAVGCGPSQASFDSDYASKYCALMFQCEDASVLATLGWEDEDACVASQSVVDTGATSNFDPKAARRCLDALDGVTCDDLAANTFPVVCAEVQ